MFEKFVLALTLTVGAGFAHASDVPSAGDAEAGKGKSATCQACHGGDGNSVNPEWPKLAGQHAGYIAKQLAEFKSGGRANATMGAMVAGLTPQDMADLGAYYERQTIQVGAASADRVSAGEALYRGGNKVSGAPACMACHGPGGTGNPAAMFPALGGQHAAYVATALRDYRRGARGKYAGAVMMQDVAAKLTDEEIESVSEYIAGLH